MSRASTIFAQCFLSISSTLDPKPDGKCLKLLDFRLPHCCHYAVVFDKLTSQTEASINQDGNVPKLNEYVKVAEAAGTVGVSQGTVRTRAADGRIPMNRNPANGCRRSMRDDLIAFSKSIEKPVKTQSKTT